MAGLLPEQRSVFELTEFEGFSDNKISESTGLPVFSGNIALGVSGEKLYSLWLELTYG